MEKRRAALQRFLSATRAGFLFAGRQPAEAAAILAPFVPEGDRDIDLELSQRFLAWLSERGLEQQPLSAAELTTNELLPAQ